MALREQEMHDAITSEVEEPGRGKRLVAQVRITHPEVTTKELAAAYPTYITVSQSEYKLRLFRNLKLVKEYPVAVGGGGYYTPTGLHSIQDKQVDPTWNVPTSSWAGDLAGQSIPPGPSNPLKSRWMGIYDGAGIHGTDDTGSIGSAASHGCIRMLIPDVEDALRPGRGRHPDLHPVGPEPHVAWHAEGSGASPANLSGMAEVAPEPALGASWREALAVFDRELSATGAAEATRRAYGTDLDQLAHWAESRRLEPAGIGHRDLRRYAAELSGGGASAATVARKLAAARSFFNSLLRAGLIAANPADLVASPKRARSCRGC